MLSAAQALARQEALSRPTQPTPLATLALASAGMECWPLIQISFQARLHDLSSMAVRAGAVRQLADLAAAELCVGMELEEEAAAMVAAEVAAVMDPALAEQVAALSAC